MSRLVKLQLPHFKGSLVSTESQCAVLKLERPDTSLQAKIPACPQGCRETAPAQLPAAQVPALRAAPHQQER